MSLLRPSLLLATIALLAACTGPHPEAHIPSSGATGLNGGSETTLHYDNAGRPHFQG